MRVYVGVIRLSACFRSNIQVSQTYFNRVIE